jgi:hypothetical protein
MNKTVIIGIVVLLAILAGIIYLIMPEKPYYSDAPNDWTEKTAEGTYVDIEKATKGQSFDNERNEYFIVNGTRTSFKYEGFYNGNYFEKEYLENGKIRMRVGTTLNPNDGIIEGIATERINNGVYEVLIFVDEDWRKQMPSTNIIWGAKYQLVKPYSFTPVRDGIYLSIIEDDPERFGDNHHTSYAGIIVGAITPAEVKEGQSEGKTLLIFQ